MNNEPLPQGNPEEGAQAQAPEAPEINAQSFPIHHASVSASQVRPPSQYPNLPEGALPPNSKAVTASTNKLLTSMYRGVCWNRKNYRWQASLNNTGRYIYLGSYKTQEEAAAVFDRAALRLRGARARLNFARSNYVDAAGELLPDPGMDRLLAEAQNPQLKPNKRARTLTGSSPATSSAQQAADQAASSVVQAANLLSGLTSGMAPPGLAGQPGGHGVPPFLAAQGGFQELLAAASTQQEPGLGQQGVGIPAGMTTLFAQYLQLLAGQAQAAGLQLPAAHAAQQSTSGLGQQGMSSQGGGFPMMLPLQGPNQQSLPMPGSVMSGAPGSSGLSGSASGPSTGYQNQSGTLISLPAGYELVGIPNADSGKIAAGGAAGGGGYQPSGMMSYASPGGQAYMHTNMPALLLGDAGEAQMHSFAQMMMSKESPSSLQAGGAPGLGAGGDGMPLGRVMEQQGATGQPGGGVQAQQLGGPGVDPQLLGDHQAQAWHMQAQQRSQMQAQQVQQLLGRQSQFAQEGRQQSGELGQSQDAGARASAHQHMMGSSQALMLQQQQQQQLLQQQQAMGVMGQARGPGLSPAHSQAPGQGQLVYAPLQQQGGHSMPAQQQQQQAGLSIGLEEQQQLQQLQLQHHIKQEPHLGQTQDGHGGSGSQLDTRHPQAASQHTQSVFSRRNRPHMAVHIPVSPYLGDAPHVSSAGLSLATPASCATHVSLQDLDHMHSSNSLVTPSNNTMQLVMPRGSHPYEGGMRFDGLEGAYQPASSTLELQQQQQQQQGGGGLHRPQAAPHRRQATDLEQLLSSSPHMGPAGAASNAMFMLMPPTSQLQGGRQGMTQGQTQQQPAVGQPMDGGQLGPAYGHYTLAGGGPASGVQPQYHQAADAGQQRIQGGIGSMQGGQPMMHMMQQQVSNPALGMQLMPMSSWPAQEQQQAPAGHPQQRLQ